MADQRLAVKSMVNYYEVLSKPRSPLMPNYKGLYRVGPLPQSNESNRFLSLWQRYAQHADKNPGVTTELSIDELHEFANLATQQTGDYYEVIFFSESFECPHRADYYGIDVVGFGGYSMVGEGFFAQSESHLYDLLNRHFMAQLNSSGLFSAIEDASIFRGVLNDLNRLSPGCVEQEDWRIVHVFNVTRG